MANKPSSITHHTHTFRVKDSNGSSKSLTKNKDSSKSLKILAPEQNNNNNNIKNQDCDKKRCFEVEVIDDTALIEATAAVTRFKNRYSGLGFEKNVKKIDGSDGMVKKMMKKNRGIKKQGRRGLAKCATETKAKEKAQAVGEKTVSGRKVLEGKGQKVSRKMVAAAKVKYVYRKKDVKDVKTVVVGEGVEEREKIENESVVDKIVVEAVQETESDESLKVLSGNEKEFEMKLAETESGSDVNLKVLAEDEKESAVELVETDTVNEKDDGFKTSFQDDVNSHNEAEDRKVCEKKDVGAKKSVYSREEMEALRFVDEEGQKTKWAEVYSGFGSSVAKEYTGLVIDVNNRPTQRYNRVGNCGVTRPVNAILGMSPVVPLFSPSSYRKFEAYDRVQSKLKSPS